MEDYLSACRILLPHFLPYLKNSEGVTHEQFKVNTLILKSTHVQTLATLDIIHCIIHNYVYNYIII